MTYANIYLYGHNLALCDSFFCDRFPIRKKNHNFEEENPMNIPTMFSSN